MLYVQYYLALKNTNLKSVTAVFFIFQTSLQVWLSRQRGESAATFVTVHDITFAALYRAGVTHNVRDYLKARWDCSKIDPQMGKLKFANTKDVFLKMGMSEAEAETKSQAADEIFRRLKNDQQSNRALVMMESLLFISGVVPFNEYAAKWIEVSGPFRIICMHARS